MISPLLFLLGVLQSASYGGGGSATQANSPSAYAIEKGTVASLAADTLSLSDTTRIADTTGLAAPPVTIKQWLNPPAYAAPLLRFGDGHIYILAFTASWCSGCPDTYPPLTALAHDYTAKGVRVMLVTGLDEVTVDYIKEYMQNHHVTLPVVVNDIGNPRAFQQFGIRTLPLIVVIDQRGIVRYRWADASVLQENAQRALGKLLHAAPN